MARYLDPKNDLVFKRIFGEHPHLLKSFLNALMPLEEGRYIESLEYLSPENVPENPLKKFSIVDVRCKDNYGRYFIVEMQMQWSTVFPSRMLLNVSRSYSRQIDKGDDYDILHPVYGLGILNQSFDNKTPEFYHRYQMANCKNTSETIDGIEIILVELPKFKPESVEEKKMAVLWLRFLKEIKDGARVISGDLLANKEINEAVTICEEAAFTDMELYAYERYWMDISNEKSMLSNSFREGLAVGDQERQTLKQEISEKDRVLSEKDKALEARDKEIEELKRLLNKQ
ncbi:hypothetical protein FACS1894181_17780 [Bacteroidia bacterium]|nr:hypothetical protein FACS1894181_17780 [Bacteroidia bacterium]